MESKDRKTLALVRNRSRRSERRKAVKRLREARRQVAWLLSGSFGAPLRAPEEIAVERGTSHTELCEFLAELRNRALSAPNSSLVVDFRRTRRIAPGGMLLLYSELQRIRAAFASLAFRCVPSRDDVVNQVLEHLGVFALMGRHGVAAPQREDVVRWRKLSGTTVDSEAYGPLIEMQEELSTPLAKQLFRGVAEATTNVIHHADSRNRGDGIPAPGENKWWMFLRQEESMLYVGVCDLGIGIPKSLPARYPGEILGAILESIGGGSNDGAMIRGAFELARTRTNQSERGKGLPDVRRVVDSVSGSKLFVLSNRGILQYGSGEFDYGNRRKSIMGTLIVWQLPLDGEKDVG